MDPSTQNQLRLLPYSSAHYFCTAELHQQAIHAIVDTGGARTMIDREAAERLGLQIDKATKRTKYGSYWGPGGRETFYYGRVKGPL